MVLDKARAEYDRQKQLIETAAEAIDAIGTVTLESTADISAARKAFHAAEPYDIDGTLIEREAVLEQAEAKIKQLQEEQKQIQKEASESVEKVVSLIVSGENEKAKTLFTSIVVKLAEPDAKTDFGNSVVKALYAAAQVQYDNEKYWNAVNALRQSAVFESYCDSKLLEKAESLEASFVAEISKNTPKNGEILGRTYGAGRNTFTVKAGNYDVCFKLELVDNPEKFIIFYVKANQSTKINILNGEYIAKYTAGPIWYGEDMMFGPDATYYQEPEILETAGYTSSDAIHWHNWTYTIYPEERWGDQNMNPADF